MPASEAPPPADDVLAAFENAVIASGQARVNRQSLWAMWNRADPGWAGSWGARPRLSDALARLADAGVVELPAQGGRLWDRAVPPLPLRLAVPVNWRQRAVSLDPAAEPWAPALDWVPGWIRTARPPDRLRRSAVQINRWMLATTGRPPPRVAREERSLHVFDNEKLLAALTAGPLFGDHRLNLDQLACDTPLGSLRVARLAATGPVLVLENKSTFDSAWRALRHADAPGYAAVVFGGGDAAAALIDDLVSLQSLIDVKASCFDYAGDVDVAGVEAAVAFATAGQKAGLEVRMATVLWDAVARADPTGEDLTADGSRTTVALAAADRLGLSADVLRRLGDRARVPQERVDRTALADTAWWSPS